jgi:hypothetical protein
VSYKPGSYTQYLQSYIRIWKHTTVNCAWLSLRRATCAVHKRADECIEGSSLELVQPSTRHVKRSQGSRFRSGTVPFPRRVPFNDRNSCVQPSTRHIKRSQGSRFRSGTVPFPRRVLFDDRNSCVVFTTHTPLLAVVRSRDVIRAYDVAIRVNWLALS